MPHRGVVGGCKTSPHMEFTKRKYDSFRQFREDLASLWANRKRLNALAEGKALDPAFQARLILAVTQANECTLFSMALAQHAANAGLSPEEISALMAGDADNVPEEHAPAVLYARHWALSDGQPDPRATAAMAHAYGAETLDQIHFLIRLIHIGNRFCNTLEYWKRRVGL